MKQPTVKCPYCGARAVRRPASAVYGAAARDPGAYLYVCARYPICDAYVAAHQKTGLPMGTLANGNLRHKRIEAHRAFNRLWRDGYMDKWQAYKWLQAKLGLSERQAHIAMFSEYMCDQVIELCGGFGHPLRQAA